MENSPLPTGMPQGRLESPDGLGGAGPNVSEVSHLTVEDIDEPLRIDRYLANLASLGASRTLIQRALKSQMVRVNDKVVSSSHKVSGGERVEVSLPQAESVEIIPEDIPLEVCYEDERLLVVNKPAGMVTHPAVGARSGTMVHALLWRGVPLSHMYGKERAGIVHRLDKNTSGLLVVAKDQEAHRFLQEELMGRRIQRKYLALIWGTLPDYEGEIDAPIGRALKDRKKMAVTNVGSRDALTSYQVTESFRGYQLLELRLHTGRTHQIRVHLNHVGHPVLGDPDYGGRETWTSRLPGPERHYAKRALALIDRQALHATELVFNHPDSGEKLEITASPPSDFQEVLNLLRQECHLNR